MSRFYVNSDHVVDEQAPAGSDDTSAESPTAPSTPPAGAPTDKPDVAVPKSPAVADITIEVPEAVQKLRAERVGIHSPDATFRSEINVESVEQPELAAAVSTELRMLAGDAGMSAVQVREFADLVKAREANPPTEEQLAASEKETLHALHREFGADAKARLEEAKALVARDSRVSAIIDHYGLGSDLKTVRMIIDLARSQKIAGRL